MNSTKTSRTVAYSTNIFDSNLRTIEAENPINDQSVSTQFTGSYKKKSVKRCVGLYASLDIFNTTEAKCDKT